MDNAGVPYSGVHYLTFRLYDSSTASTALWEDTITADFDSGYYAVQLGMTPSNLLDDAIFEGDALYLGLAIDGGAELPDRIPVSSTPFARRAALADGIDGGTVNASEIQINGLTVIDGTGTFIGALSEQTLSGLGCSSGDLPQYSTSGWQCADGGIIGLSCTAGQVPTYDGSDWSCANSSDPFGALSCAADDILTYDGSDWDCASGQGLGGWSDTSAPNLLLDLVALSCTDGQSLSWDDTGGAWACSDLQDTTLSQGTVLSYVTDSAIDLAAGSTVGGSSISTSDTLADLGCLDTEIAQMVSGNWQCAPISVSSGDTLAGLNCNADEIIAYNGSTSAWECEVLALTDSDTLADLICDDGDIPSWNNSSQIWECTVLALSDADTLADLALSCASGDIPQWEGSYWSCSSASLANLTCSTDEIPMWDGALWGCVAAATATVSWNDITSIPSSLADITTNGLDEDALPFTGLNEISGGALDNEFSYDYLQDTEMTINDGQENNPTSSIATVPNVGPVLSLTVTVHTLGNSNHGALQYILRHENGGQVIDYTIVAYGDYTGSSSSIETWTVTETLHNMVSTQSVPVHALGSWTLFAYDNADLPANPTPGEDGSFTWTMQITAVTPDLVSVNGDLVVDGDLIVNGTITQSTAPIYTEATLENGWVEYGSTYAPAGYTLDGQGFVHLRGLIKDGYLCTYTGHANCVLFTLPEDYWPEYRAIFSVRNNNTLQTTRLDVLNNGQVVIHDSSTSTGWLSLEGIIFAVGP